MKLIYIIIFLFFSNLISANELENSEEVEVINLHESKSLDQMVLENLIEEEEIQEEFENLNEDNELSTTSLTLFSLFRFSKTI